MLPLGSSGPVYGIDPDEYLVDMTGGEVLVTPHQLNEAAPGTTNAYAAAVTAQVRGLVNLNTSIQTPTPTATAMTLSAKPMGGLAPDYSTSNGVPYLTIAAAGTSQFLITVFNSTNQGSYYLEMTPLLALATYVINQIELADPYATSQANGAVMPQVTCGGIDRSALETVLVHLSTAH